MQRPPSAPSTKGPKSSGQPPRPSTRERKEGGAPPPPQRSRKRSNAAPASQPSPAAAPAAPAAAGGWPAASFLTLNSDQLRDVPGQPDPFPLVLDWLERSLQTYAEVTVITLEPWLACAVTVIALAADRGLAVLADLNTMAMDEGADKWL
ncbi:hypothetical protein H9P43_005154 [Blastocladiella emersonii ATCC 22665]|nr:hypothetical protein H9P43_005154 [Blastocladiella emersonii ATCC 22665]